MSHRRKLVAALCVGPLAWSFALHAQAPAKMRRIGLLSQQSPADTGPWYEAFRQGLRDLGWIEGKNVGIEYRYAEGHSDRLPELAADLVRLKVDVVVATASTDALAAQRATKAIPIVMTAGGEPAALGLVESPGRPGGNVTGLSQMIAELAGKRLEMLKEMVPRLARAAVLWNPQSQSSQLYWKELQRAARQLGVELHSLEVRDPSQLDKAFEDATQASARAGALVIVPSPVITTNLKRITSLAAKHRLPSIYHVSEFADAGGLMAYGPNRTEMFRRAATFVDKILKGTKPADLPVEQPTTFELVVNMKTAKALGLSVPQTILVRADRLIQ